MLRVTNISICILFALISSISMVGQQATPQLSGGISGIVRYPDGMPSGGASVIAETDCGDMGFRLVHEVKTSMDGTFYIPPFHGASCNRVRLSADKKEDLWLPTGHDVFYEGENGTSTIVDASWIGSPTVTEIKLRNRGAFLALRVLDNATGRYIRAELNVERTPVSGSKFGSMLIATGRDGSPDTLLLPAGEYVITVTQYSCGAADYFTARGPQKVLTLQAGQRIETDISVDIRLIKPMKSYSNPHGRPCKP